MAKDTKTYVKDIFAFLTVQSIDKICIVIFIGTLSCQYKASLYKATHLASHVVDVFLLFQSRHC